MTIPALLVVGVVLLAATFALTPLLRDEEDIEGLRRPRPGTRHLHGPGDLRSDSETAEHDTDGGGAASEQGAPRGRESRQNGTTHQCPHCGAAVDRAFDYCAECLCGLE